VSCLSRRQNTSREKKSFSPTMRIPSGFPRGVSAICVRCRRHVATSCVLDCATDGSTCLLSRERSACCAPREPIKKPWVEPEDREVPERSSNVSFIAVSHVGKMNGSRNFLSSLIN